MGSQYNINFDPVLLPNETATLFGADFPPDGKPVRCRAIGALPERIKDFGTLTAGSWSTEQEDTGLELSANELGQYRMRVLTDMKAKLKNPSAYQQWRSSTGEFELKRFPTEPGQDFLTAFLFRASEFYVWKDSTPRFLFYGTVAVEAYVWFGGWKIKVEEIRKEQLTSRQEIWINAFPSGK